MFLSWRRRLENFKSEHRIRDRRRRSSPAGVFFKPKLEQLEERIALNYSFGATAFEPINLVSGAPGVFTIINFADDATASVDLGSHHFNFYGTSYTGANSLFVSSNGLITFGSGDAQFLNSDLTTNPSQASISPLWEDFFKFSGGPMILGEFDDVHSRLIIQWDQVRDPSSTNLVTFETILQLNTGNTPGDIIFNYSVLDYFDGAAATVGLKDALVQGPNRVLVSFKALDPLVTSAAAILFTPEIPLIPPAVTSLSQASLPEGSAPITLTVNGSNFASNSVVEANGVALATTFVSDSQLQAAVPAPMLTEEGTLPITVIGPAGLSSNAQDLTITDVPLTVSNQNLAGVEGQALTNVLVATFTDLGSDGTAWDYSATVTWDDGGGQSHASTGIIQSPGNNTFNVYASNTVPYAEEGGHDMTVTINDLGGSSTVITSTVNVADAPLTLSAQTVLATEGSVFTGVVASLTDANPGATAGDYTAAIDWGDGTKSPGSVTLNANGGFDVSGSHIYAEESPYSINVTVLDLGGSSATVAASAAVADAPLTAAGTTIASTEGMPFAGAVASFTDANPNGAVGEFAATITWGDGRTSSGTITANAGGGFAVTGTHTYAEEGVNVVAVTITDAGGSIATANGTTNVADAPLTVVSQATAAGFQNITTGQQPLAVFGDAAGVESAIGEYRANIDWGDGTPSEQGVIGISNGKITVFGSHTFADGGTFHPHVLLADAGSSVTGVGTVNVATDISSEVRAWNTPANGDALEEIDFVKNTSGSNITGPFQIVLTGLDPSIHLVSASFGGVSLSIGYTATGDPYVTVDISTLTIGQPLKIDVAFSNPLGLDISYDLETFADQFTS
jgi:hypothetical protein